MNAPIDVSGQAARAAPAASHHVTTSPFSQYTETIAGEPLSYPSSPNPVVSTNELIIPPGTVTPWMVHPVQAFLYLLEGVLTVEFAEDGSRHTFKAGQGFLQTRSHWHRGRNDGDAPARFVAVFIGAKGVPEMLHPPAGKLVDK
jgi:quercetin dioxygenase-like cupin family protein